jgi:hypothetical protein
MGPAHLQFMLGLCSGVHTIKAAQGRLQLYRGLLFSLQQLALWCPESKQALPPAVLIPQASSLSHPAAATGASTSTQAALSLPLGLLTLQQSHKKQEKQGSSLLLLSTWLMHPCHPPQTPPAAPNSSLEQHLCSRRSISPGFSTP